MQTEPPSVEISFTNEFERRLQSLSKKYRRIGSDIQPLIEQLQAGETPGDRISGTGTTAFKVRVKNSDIKKGKSGAIESSTRCFTHKHRTVDHLLQI